MTFGYDGRVTPSVCPFGGTYVSASLPVHLSRKVRIGCRAIVGDAQNPLSRLTSEPFLHRSLCQPWPCTTFRCFKTLLFLTPVAALVLPTFHPPYLAHDRVLISFGAVALTSVSPPALLFYLPTLAPFSTIGRDVPSSSIFGQSRRLPPLTYCAPARGSLGTDDARRLPMSVSLCCA